MIGRPMWVKSDRTHSKYAALCFNKMSPLARQQYYELDGSSEHHVAKDPPKSNSYPLFFTIYDRSYNVPGYLEFAMKWRMTLNLNFLLSCLHLPSARIIGACYHTQFIGCWRWNCCEGFCQLCLPKPRLCSLNLQPKSCLRSFWLSKLLSKMEEPSWSLWHRILRIWPCNTMTLYHIPN